MTCKKCVQKIYVISHWGKEQNIFALSAIRFSIQTVSTYPDLTLGLHVDSS